MDTMSLLSGKVLMQYLPAWDDGAVAILSCVERIVYQYFRTAKTDL